MEEQLTVKVVADVTGFKSQVSSATKETQQDLSQISKQLQAIKSGDMKAILGAAGLGGAVKATLDLKKRITEIKTELKANHPGLFGYMKIEKTENGVKGIKRLFEAIKDVKLDKQTSNLPELTAELKSLKAGAASALITLAALAFEVAIVAKAFKAASEAAKTINKAFSQGSKIGMSTNEYMKWSYMLDQVGVDVSALESSMKKLNQTQSNIKLGATSNAAAFQKLGMSLDFIQNASSEDLFNETIKGLQGIENEVDRSAIAYEIFGKNAANLAPIFNSSAADIERMAKQFDLLGGNATQQLIDRSNTLQASIGSMKQAFQGLANTLGEWLIPVITSVVRKITIAVAYINILLRAILGFSSSAKKTSSLNDNMNNYSKAINGATSAAEKLKRTTMGFDELNIVGNPSSGSSGTSMEDFDISPLNAADSLLSDEDYAKIENFKNEVEKIKNVLQTAIPIILIAVGLIGAAVCLFSGNILGAVACAGIAGLGFAIAGENGFWDRWKAGWNQIKDFFAGIWESMVNSIKLKIEMAKLIFLQAKIKFNNFIEGIKTTIKTIKNTVSDVWSGIKSTVSSIASWINSNIVKPIANFFSGLWTGIKNGVHGLTSAFKTVFEGLWTVVKTPLNWIIDGINKLVKGLNKIKWDVPDWVPSIGGKKLGFNIATIPKLATGGIATSSTIANIGEAGKEAILPLENNTEWMDALADRIAARNNTPSKIVLAVDGKAFAQASINSINDLTRQTGSLQLKLV